MSDDELDEFMENYDSTEDDRLAELLEVDSPLTVDETMGLLGLPEKAWQGYERLSALANEVLTESERKRITIELNTDGGRPTIEFGGDDDVVTKLTREAAKRGCLPKGEQANN